MSTGPPVLHCVQLRDDADTATLESKCQVIPAGDEPPCPQSGKIPQLGKGEDARKGKAEKLLLCDDHRNEHLRLYFTYKAASCEVKELGKKVAGLYGVKDAESWGREKLDEAIATREEYAAAMVNELEKRRSHSRRFYARADIGHAGWSGRLQGHRTRNSKALARLRQRRDILVAEAARVHAEDDQKLQDAQRLTQEVALRREDEEHRRIEAARRLAEEEEAAQRRKKEEAQKRQEAEQRREKEAARRREEQEARMRAEQAALKCQEVADRTHRELAAKKQQEEAARKREEEATAARRHEEQAERKREEAVRKHREELEKMRQEIAAMKQQEGRRQFAQRQRAAQENSEAVEWLNGLQQQQVARREAEEADARRLHTTTRETQPLLSDAERSPPSPAALWVPRTVVSQPNVPAATSARSYSVDIERQDTASIRVRKTEARRYQDAFGVFFLLVLALFSFFIFAKVVG